MTHQDCAVASLTVDTGHITGDNALIMLKPVVTRQGTHSLQGHHDMARRCMVHNGHYSHGTAGIPLDILVLESGR